MFIFENVVSCPQIILTQYFNNTVIKYRRIEIDASWVWKYQVRDWHFKQKTYHWGETHIYRVFIFNYTQTWQIKRCFSPNFQLHENDENREKKKTMDLVTPILFFKFPFGIPLPLSLVYLHNLIYPAMVCWTFSKRMFFVYTFILYPVM